jgi:YggT family protein
MIIILISAVDIIARLIILILIIHVVLTYFMSPFHPIRQRIDQIIEPMLRPIRRMIPTVGMIDFSPLILIILVQVVNLVIKRLLISLL